MPEESEKTSLKAMIQQITGEGAQILQGVVKSVSPLKIQMAEHYLSAKTFDRLHHRDYGGLADRTCKWRYRHSRVCFP